MVLEVREKIVSDVVEEMALIQVMEELMEVIANPESPQNLPRQHEEELDVMKDDQDTITIFSDELMQEMVHFTDELIDFRDKLGGAFAQGEPHTRGK